MTAEQVLQALKADLDRHQNKPYLELSGSTFEALEAWWPECATCSALERITGKLLQLDPDGAVRVSLDASEALVDLDSALVFHPYQRSALSSESLTAACEQLERLTLDPMLAELNHG